MKHSQKALCINYATEKEKNKEIEHNFIHELFTDGRNLCARSFFLRVQTI